MTYSWFDLDLYEDAIQPVCWRCAHVLSDDEYEAGDYCFHCSECPGCFFCTA